MLGRQLGHFEIVSLLGEGGMGAVYKARDTHLERLVALKVLPHDKMADPERKRRFSQEAKAASALNHPNIITIYDIASDEGVDFIAMEYVEGPTLEALLASGPLRIDDAIKYARQMADALAAAHAAGILHRDLKPANVIVRVNGLVKLLDFGLAKLTDVGEVGGSDTTRTMALTQAGTLMGTVAYMSPEQAEGKKLDFRSDIFSFGVVLYEMVAGKRAFKGDSQASLLASLLRDEPPPVADLRADVPLELERLIARCLRKEPERRVQTMADLKVALEDLTEFSRTTARAPARATVQQPPSVPESYGVGVPPPPRRIKRWWRFWWLAGLAFWLIPGALRQVRSVFETGRVVSDARDTTLTAVPLTRDAGWGRQPSFSPDGRQVAYSWNGTRENNFDIYIKTLGAESPRRLTSDAGEDFAPAWSPDGRTIAFLRTRERADEILLIQAEGGAERKIGEIAHRTGNGLAWTKDSQRLIFPDSPSSGAPATLYELTLATGAKRRLTKPGADGADDLWPSVSPNGTSVAFVRQSGASQSEVFTAEIPDSDDSDAEAQQVTSLGTLSAHPVWTANGKQLIFASGNSGAMDLWRVPSDGTRKPQRLVGAGEGGEDPAVALQGGRMVYGKKDGKSAALWLVEQFR
jgi:Tol biopolymer transport system component/tRNA A-37 threonylcarbamoyl transferase component Bud32